MRHSAIMLGTFRNATGTLGLYAYDNVTDHNQQVPKHGVNFSSTLKKTAPRYFDATVAEEFPPRMSQSNYMLAPQLGSTGMEVKNTTQALEPELATSKRQKSIYERALKGYEVKQAKKTQTFQPRKYTPEEVQNAEKQIAGGQIKVVRGIQKSVVKVEHKAPVLDNYYHGGDVFDDYTGRH